MTARKPIHLIHEALISERSHWILWLPVGLGLGIYGYFQLETEPPLWLGVSVIVLSAVCMVGFRRRAIFGVFLVILALASGFAAAQWRTFELQTPMLQKRTGPVSVEGYIIRIDPQISGAKVILGNLRIASLPADATPSRMRLSIKGNRAGLTNLIPGQRVRVRAIIRPPPPPVLPGAFDFQRHAYFQQIGAYGFIIGEIQNTRADMPYTLTRGIEVLRLKIFKAIYSLYPEPAGAVAAALITGHRGKIPKSALEDMRDAGIAHILAISGLHIGLVAGLVFTAVRLLFAAIPRLGLYADGKKVAASFAIPAALAYAVLAGLTVPTQRAFLMTTLIFAGVLLERRTLTMRSVCWAATVILVFRPESLVSPGFQMSFAAVVSLIAAYGWLSKRRRDALKTNSNSRYMRIVFGYIGGVVTTTLIAGLATAPFAIFHFQHAATFGMIANIVAVPLTAVWVMPSAIAALLVMPFGLAEPLLWVMVTGVDLVLRSAAWVAALPGAAIDVPVAPDWSLGGLVLGGLWLSLWQTRWRLLGIPFIVIGLGGPLMSKTPDLIVDGGARAIAVHTASEKIIVSNRRRARFETSNWQRRFGQRPDPEHWPDNAENPEGDLRCDHYGCILERGRYRVSISFSEETHFDDFSGSDLIVAVEPVWLNCPDARSVIDRFDLWRYGTHVVFLHKEGMDIRSVDKTRGHRPWVVTNDRHDNQ